MAKPKHKPREVKRKTIVDKLRGSAIFLLSLILVMIADVLAFIFWLSNLLSGKVQGSALWTNGSFIMFGSITAALLILWGIAWVIQRRAHGPRPA